MEKFAAGVPSFANLMGGAFNQDWRDEWDSAEEIVTSVLGERTDQLRSMLKDLRRIDRVCSDDDIDSLLFSLGSGFSPEADWGMSSKDWVQDLEVRLERELVAQATPESADRLLGMSFREWLIDLARRPVRVLDAAPEREHGMRRENSPRGADQCLLLPRRRPRERVGLPRSRLQPRGPPGMGRGGGIQTLAALLRTGRLHRRWLRTVRDGRTSVNTGEPVTWRGEMSSAEDGRRRTISPPVGRDPSSAAVDRRQTAFPQIETKWITWKHRPGTRLRFAHGWRLQPRLEGRVVFSRRGPVGSPRRSSGNSERTAVRTPSDSGNLFGG